VNYDSNFAVTFQKKCIYITAQCEKTKAGAVGSKAYKTILNILLDAVWKL
jgi:hypothetical protein